MSFLQNEGSLFSSRPIEYYEFDCAGEIFRYNHSKVDRTLNGLTYLGDTLIRDKYRQNKDSQNDVAMNLKVRRDHPIALMFLQIVPAKPVWVRAIRKHVQDPDSEARPFWLGRVRGCNWGSADATLTMEPITTMVKRAGLRMQNDVSCNHFLYGPACGVSSVAFRFQGTLSDVNGVNLYSNVFANKPDQYFRLGAVEFGNYFHMVIDHVGNRVTLFNAIEGIAPFDTVAAYAGCDRRLDTCWDKFRNGLNFGGKPWAPHGNIFEDGIGYK